MIDAFNLWFCFYFALFIRQMGVKSLLSLAIIVLIGIATCNAFYLPGVAPADYQDHELIDVKVTITAN
jgi:hypothetical protein